MLRIFGFFKTVACRIMKIELNIAVNNYFNNKEVIMTYFDKVINPNVTRSGKTYNIVMN